MAGFNLFDPSTWFRQEEEPKRTSSSSSGTRAREGGGSFDAPATTTQRVTPQYSGSWNAWGAAPQTVQVSTAQRTANQPINGGSWDAYGYYTQKRNDELAAEARAKEAAAENTQVIGNQRETRSNALTGQGLNTFETKEMSWDDYVALSPQQRAAVDANTAIASAVAEDQAAWRTNKQDGDADYQKAVSALFGEGGGSDIYAPKTLAVLQQLGISNSGQDDLDNYLNLSGLVTAEDLKSITPEAIAGLGKANLATYISTAEGTREKGERQLDYRVENALNLSKRAMSTLGETLARGQSLLEASTGTSSFSSATNAAVPALETLFDSLAQKDAVVNITDNEIGTALQAIQQNYGIDAQTAYKYFDQRLNAFEYGGAEGSLGAQEGITYVSPDEFRARYYRNGA